MRWSFAALLDPSLPCSCFEALFVSTEDQCPDRATGSNDLAHLLITAHLAATPTLNRWPDEFRNILNLINGDGLCLLARLLSPGFLSRQRSPKVIN